MFCDKLKVKLFLDCILAAFHFCTGQKSGPVQFVFVVAFAVLSLAAFIVFFVLLLLTLFPLLTAGIFRGVTVSYYVTATNITPAYWLFYITWPAIVISLVVTLGYTFGAIVFLFPLGPAIINPSILTAPCFFNLFLGLLTGAFYHLTQDKFLIFPRVIPVSLGGFISVFLFFASGIAMNNYANKRAIFISSGRLVEAFLLRFFTLNGLAAFTTWMIYLTAFGATFIMPVGNIETASIITMGFLIAATALHFLLDVSVLERITRFVLSPYIVLIVSMISTILQGFDPAAVSSLMVAALLGMSTAFFFAKLAVSAFNSVVVPATAVQAHRESLYKYIEDEEKEGDKECLLSSLEYEAHDICTLKVSKLNNNSVVV